MTRSGHRQRAVAYANICLDIGDRADGAPIFDDYVRKDTAQRLYSSPLDSAAAIDFAILLRRLLRHPIRYCQIVNVIECSGGFYHDSY